LANSWGTPPITNNIPKGCSNFDIPNCKYYKLQRRQGSDKDDFLCNECSDGATKFSTWKKTSFILDAARSPPLRGIGCPLDNAW
jgi:hypothetical protein